ncbi:O-antigen ligase family protein [Cecembia rubra]|uniref:O-antigen ligase-related domain-containing protein n=1 Tax=Cecembia rubra TaxID=1485585 RepID=A0A2P8EAW7_9BACT|nr:O-antigen ligase family protein [Cecembia rubra]PSL06611.1 hypothetical protein CLV48_102429 [Cecembia rubra]
MNPKLNKFDYFLTFFFLLITSKGTFITQSNIIWGVFLLILISYSFYMKRVFKGDLMVFLYFMSGYLLLLFVRNYTINLLPFSSLVSDILFLFKYILLSYAFCLALKENLFYQFSTVVYHLTLISLIFYTVQLLGGGDKLFSIGKIVMGFLPPMDDIPYTYSNIIVFTYDRLHSIRNSGFAWEPGAFGCFLVFAIYFHLIQNNFKLDKRFLILSIALATTLSTTAFVSYAVLCLFIYRQKGGSWNLGLVALLTIITLAFIYLPFLGDKITQTYKEDLEKLEDFEAVKSDLQYYFENGGEVKLNRFSSAVFTLRHLKEKLILGVGNTYGEIQSTVYEVPISKFNLTNSIFDFMARFGLVGLLFLLFQVGRLAFIKFGSYEAAFYQIVIFLSLGFGEPIFALPLGLIFIFIPYLSFGFEDDENEEIVT